MTAMELRQQQVQLLEAITMAKTHLVVLRRSGGAPSSLTIAKLEAAIAKAEASRR